MVIGTNMYMDATKQSGDFIMANLKITQPGNGIIGLSASANADCHNDTIGPSDIVIDNVGTFLSGLSVLPSDMQLGNMSVSEM
jgi:hypothetical protein